MYYAASRAEGNKEFYVCRVGDSSNSRRALTPLKTIPFVFLGALSRFRWDYCGEQLKNSYPTYFKRLPALVKKINAEKKNSKNYVLFLGETGVETNQQPCLSLVQFQIEDDSLVLSAYQRSSDANLGLPADIYHLYLMARQIDLPLKSITLFLGNVNIYESNLLRTYELLNGAQDVKFELNV